jgi:hypothetical protein
VHVLQQEIAELTLAFGHDFLVSVSDVDELLDPALLQLADIDQCRTPTLRHYHYGVHCVEYKPAFARSVIFRSSSAWFNTTLNHRRFSYDPLRNLVVGRGPNDPFACPPTRGFVGWHLSYFLPGAQILTKLRSFSHAHDSDVSRVISSPAPLSLIAERARKCITLRGAPLRTELLPYAASGRRTVPAGLPRSSALPPLPNWPQHPSALTLRDFTADQVQEEAGRCARMLNESANVLANRHEQAAANCSGIARGCTARGRFNVEYSPGLFQWLANPKLTPHDMHHGRKVHLDTMTGGLSHGTLSLWKAAAHHYDVKRSCTRLKLWLRWLRAQTHEEVTRAAGTAGSVAAGHVF